MKVTKCGNGQLYTIPLSNIDYIGYFYALNGNEDIQSAMKRITAERGSEPDILMNGELFDFITRRAASDVVSKGVPHRLTESYGIAFPKNKTAVFSYKNNVNAPDYIGAYPVLVRNGKEEKHSPAGITGRRGRTALGLDDNKNLYAVLVSDKTGLTLSQLRSALLKAGALNAINLDGGGSTQFYAPNGNYFSGRRVRGFIGIWFKKPTASKPTTSKPAATVAKPAPAKEDIRTVTALLPLRIRQEPTTQSKIMGWLYKGNKVKVLKEENGWCKIDKGYVSSSYLKK